MTTLSVPDMSCGHCKASIEAALAPFGGRITFDMAARALTLDAAQDIAPILAVLNDIGFPAQVVAK